MSDGPHAGALVRLAQATVLALCVIGLYAPVLSSGFLNWDDDVVLVQNPAVTSPDGLARIWSTIELPAGFPNYPLVFTLYWIEHRLWGLDPAVFHAGNVLLHALNACLVLFLARALGLRPWVAFAAALLFAVHPVQVESVAWIAERKNLLGTFFALITCLSYLRFRATGRRSWYSAVLLAFAAALLSKSATVVVPPSLALADLLYLRRRLSDALRALLPLFALALAAGLLTVAAENRPPSVPPIERLLVAATALWFYFGLLLAPLQLMPIHPRWEVSSTALLCWVPLACLIAALPLWYRITAAPIRWGLGHFAVALVPALGLIPYGFNEMSYVAERHAYLPSVGFFLALAAMAVSWLRRLRPAIAISFLLVLTLALLVCTRQQIAVWRDSETLWNAAIAKNPAAWAAYNNLALAYIQQGRLEEAAPLLETALALNPDSAQAENNRALVLYRSGAFGAAAEHCRRALALKPGNSTYLKNLGLALAAAGDTAGAAGAFGDLVRNAPSASSHAFLADLLAAQGRIPEAIVHYEQALRLDPSLLEIRNQLGRALLAVGRLPEAAHAFAEVVGARPGWPEARFNLSLALQQLGQADAAAAELEQVLALRPDFTEARAALAALRPAKAP